MSNLGIPVTAVPGDQTIAEVANSWLEQRRLRYANCRSLRDVERAIASLILPSLGSVALSALTMRDLQALKGAIIQQTSSDLAYRALLYARGILWHAADMDLISADLPTKFFVVKPQCACRVRRTPDATEVRELLKAAQTQILNDQHRLPAAFDVQLMLLVETGIRPNELIDLTWADVNPQNCAVSVPSSREHNVRRRTIPITETLSHRLSRAALELGPTSPERLLFQGRLGLAQSSHTLSRALRNLQLIHKDLKSGSAGGTTERERHLLLRDLRAFTVQLWRVSGLISEEMRYLLGRRPDRGNFRFLLHEVRADVAAAIRKGTQRVLYGLD